MEYRVYRLCNFASGCDSARDWALRSLGKGAGHGTHAARAIRRRIVLAALDDQTAPRGTGCLPTAAAAASASAASAASAAPAAPAAPTAAL